MIRYKTYFVLFIALTLFFGCKEEGSNNGNSTGDGGGDGTEFPLLDYFYNLDDGETFNVKFYRKDATTLANPTHFAPEEDTVNFSTTDYILSIEQGSFEAAVCEAGINICESGQSADTEYSTLEECQEDPNCANCVPNSEEEDIVYTSLSDCNDDIGCVDCVEFTDLSLIEREYFDETQGDTCEEINQTTCPDLDGDGALTDQGLFEDLYKSGSVSFSYDYKDLRKMEWNDENDRYSVVMGPKETLDTTYTYDDDPDSNPFGHTDRFDSLVYVVTVDVNNYSGFTYTDENENGVWDSTEDFTVGENLGYFDSSEWTRVEDDYSVSYLTFDNTFDFNKVVISEDSLMFRVSTDCNDNGKWDTAEPTAEAGATEEDCANGKWYGDISNPFCDIGNLVWDAGEPIVHENIEEDGEDSWDYGELYQDRNCNGYWDGPESINETHCVEGESNGEEYETSELCESDTSCTECESLCQNGLWISDVDIPFCDVGNGVQDENEYCYCDETLEAGATCNVGDNSGATYNSIEECEAACELCSDGITPDCVANPITDCAYTQIYSMSDRPEQLLVSYQLDPEGTSGVSEYPLYSIINPIDTLSTVLPRWGDNSIDISQALSPSETDLEQRLIDWASDSYSDIKYIPDLDSTVVVYSNQIVEALGSGFEDNYHITKTVWYEESQTPGVYDRFYDYHLFRVGDDGNIYELVHNHYLTLEYPDNLSQLPAEYYEEYLHFDEQATEEIYIEVNEDGMLEDGYSSSSYNEMQYNSENFGWYSVDREYRMDLIDPDGFCDEDAGQGCAFEEGDLVVPLRKLIGCDCSTEYDCMDRNFNSISDLGIWLDACGDVQEFFGAICNIGDNLGITYNSIEECEAVCELCVEEEDFCTSNGNSWVNETCYSTESNSGGLYCHSLERIVDVDDEITNAEGCPFDSTLTDVFTITRTVKKTILGPGIENEQENTIWLARGLGIVKDQLSYRFNYPSDWQGLYQLEIADRYESETSSQRSLFNSLFDSKRYISKEQIGEKAGLDYEPYQKTAKFGLQRMKIGANKDGK